MITFDDTRLSQRQAITATAGSTKTLKFKTVQQAQAFALPTIRGCQVVVEETFNNFTSLTVKVQERTNDAGTWTDVVTLASAVARATLVKGYVIYDGPMPKGIKKNTLRFHYTVNGTAPSTGTVSADMPSLESGYGTGDKAVSAAEGAARETTLVGR